MVQILEIENGLVRRVDRIVSEALPLEELLPHLAVPQNDIVLFHPRSAIFTARRKVMQTTEMSFLCELGPGRRTITKLDRTYDLSMPWTYFIFSFASNNPEASSWSLNNRRVFHAPQRVTTTGDRLWAAFLPNVDDHANICFGSTGVPTDLPLAQRVDQMVDTWYLTEFNNDMHAGRVHPLPFNGSLPNGWRLWVEATREHGGSAFLQFPEWTAPHTRHERSGPNWTVEDLLRQGSQRPTVYTSVDAIQPIVEGATFGRVEQYVAEVLDPVQRLRLEVALANHRAEHPENFAVPEPTTAPAALEDDGGIPIPRTRR